jgi:hypothetical protein
MDIPKKPHRNIIEIPQSPIGIERKPHRHPFETPQESHRTTIDTPLETPTKYHRNTIEITWNFQRNFVNIP